MYRAPFSLCQTGHTVQSVPVRLSVHCFPAAQIQTYWFPLWFTVEKPFVILEGLLAPYFHKHFGFNFFVVFLLIFKTEIYDVELYIIKF